MIKTFRHKGLRLFYESGSMKGIDAAQAERIGRILDRLDGAIEPEDMNLPGYRFHGLIGNRAGTYSVRVSSNLRIVFAFAGQDAIDVDLVDYH